MNRVFKEMLKDAEKASKSIKPIPKKKIVSMLCEISQDFDENDLMRLSKRNLQLILGLLRQQ
tara:strand:+ start:828 stop:1013 length:186 start_codon:yes stop_codon:yes gene_type:complete